ncbi:MAG TPA: hypothetical protein VGP90_06265 [Acidimicrobiia bacterium]|nr:hypothetical protein [Acidimicrobiia bacterium]
MSPRRRLLAVTGLAAVTGLLLGGCDSGSKAASHGAAETTTATSPRVTAPAALDPSSTAAGAPTGPPCTVATAALVGGKLGFPLAGPNVDRGPSATICTYDNPSNQAQSATVQLTSGATPDSFARSRTGFAGHGEVVTDVAGLGDQAFSATLAVANVTNTTLVARKGSTEVLITTTAPAGAVPGLMTAILALI